MAFKESEVEIHEQEPFTGTYGFVLIPEDFTVQKIVDITKEICPAAGYKTSLPHITLYHN